MTKYVAVINTPGYLPQVDEPPVFDTAREAWQYLVSEVEREWDECRRIVREKCRAIEATFAAVGTSRVSVGPGAVARLGKLNGFLRMVSL